MEPEILWTNVIKVAKEAMSSMIFFLKAVSLYKDEGCVMLGWELLTTILYLTDAELTAADIACIGLATQRGTFLTWQKSTGKPFHNFMVWKDIRTQEMVNTFNSSLPAKVQYLFSYS